MGMHPKQEPSLEDQNSTNNESFLKKIEVPTTFNQAWNHPDQEQREKWRKAVDKELDKMKKMGVWEKIPKSRMPPNKRCVKHKWVLNIKRNGVFRARLVACGYSQIPGVDFTENFAPVINDVTYRILLILSIMKGYKPVLIDVETAFLHGD